MIIDIKNSIFIIVILFAISIIVRLDIMQEQPIGKAYFHPTFQRSINAEVNVHSLEVFSIYETFKSDEHWYLPYHGVGVSNRYNDVLQVYISFPPAFFYVPYFISKIFFVAPDQTFLQVFNLILHLLCVLLLFFIGRSMALKLIDEKRKSIINLIALMGASLYLFNSNALFNHSNVYWAHQLLQPVFLFSILILLDDRLKKMMPIVILVAFLMPYITWTGYLASFAMLLSYFIHEIKMFKNNKSIKCFKFSILIGCSVILAFLINLFHFLICVDFSEMIQAISVRIAERSTFYDDIHHVGLLGRFINASLFDFGIYLIIIVVLVFMNLSVSKKFYMAQFFIILLACIPCLETVVLMGHDFIYTFGRLKFMVPLLLIIFYLLALTFKNFEHYPKRVSGVVVVVLLIGFLVTNIANINNYRALNRTNYNEYKEDISFYVDNLMNKFHLIDPKYRNDKGHYFEALEKTYKERYYTLPNK